MTAFSNCSESAIEVRVYYEDTDFSGNVYHASYLRFLERGRTEWLRSLGFRNLELSRSFDLVFAVRRMRVDFFAPAEMDDLLRVETTLSSLRGASIEFMQQISRGERKLVTAAILVAAIRGGRPARLPDKLRHALRVEVRGHECQYASAAR